MASTILSSSSYINYLNDYINLILKSSDQYLIEHLYETYFDEIENLTCQILAQWHSEQILDQQSSLFIENVGYLHRKLCLLIETGLLNKTQTQRIENLLFNCELIQLLTSIIQSLIKISDRHEDNFLRYLSILIDAYSLMKYSKPIFNHLIEQIIQSKLYQDYLHELFSLNIQPKHLFFIGAIGQLAVSSEDLILNKIYSEFFQKVYHKKTFVTINSDLYYCTLGIFSQLDISYLMNDYSCLSILTSMFLNENLQIFHLKLLDLFNSLCIQSKTVACYLNTNQLINKLLQSVSNENRSYLNLQSCLLLGHIINEKQLNELRISYKLLMKLMDLLCDSPENRYKILQSLLSLTIHERIQLIISETFQLNRFILLTKDYPICYDIIWKISFYPNIVEQLIIRHHDFVKELSLLSGIPAAFGILENIRMKDALHSPKTNGITCDLALISSSKDQIIIQQLKENLLKNNIHLGTITNSHSVLLCISEESKHDCSCQAAFEQALIQCKRILLCIVKKPYRIDDWFVKLNVLEKKPLDILDLKIEKCLVEIQKEFPHNQQIIKQTQIVTPSDQITDTTFTLTPSPTIIPPKIPRKKIQNWTNRDVMEWCTKNKLDAFTKILTLYDGRNLLALAHISRLSTPHTIINQLRNDCRKQGLNLSFVEYVRFQNALDELLRLERDLAKKRSISTLSSRYVFKGKTN